jgi:hypothetical protein
MSELELALTALGRELDYPATPDLTGAVRRRLADRRRPLSWRRPLLIAVAALLVAVAAAMAVPQARSQVLDWLGIGSVTIHYVDELPKLEPREEFELGARVPLAEARDRAQFAVLVPSLEGLEHPAVHYRGDIGMVSLLYGSEEEPRLLISEIVSPGAIDKLLTGATDVEPVTEGAWSGAWLSGGQHVLFLPVQDQMLRLVGKVLIVHNGSMTVRIEADVSKDEALRILRSLE